MIFPALDTMGDAALAQARANCDAVPSALPPLIDRRLAVNIAHIIRVDWVDYPWPMSRDQWADWWAESYKHQAHLLPTLSEAQMAALIEAYAYVVEAHTPREHCAATIVTLLHAIAFGSLTEAVSSPFSEASEPAGLRQREIARAVNRAPGASIDELLDELVSEQPHRQKREIRRTYRRALAQMLTAGLLTERAGQIYTAARDDFSDLIGDNKS